MCRVIQAPSVGKKDSFDSSCPCPSTKQGNNFFLGIIMHVDYARCIFFKYSNFTYTRDETFFFHAKVQKRNTFSKAGIILITANIFYPSKWGFYVITFNFKLIDFTYEIHSSLSR